MAEFYLRFWLKVGAIIWFVVFVFILAEPSFADDRTDWKAHATKMETKYSLPVGLLLAICEQESNWRNVGGAVGEIGICQVQAATVYMICPACKHGSSVTALGSFGTGPNVIRIQRALAAKGYYPGKIDGIFGPVTRAATLDYQRANALKADGVVGARTWDSLVQGPRPGNDVAATLWVPKENIEWAARYLAWLRDNVSPEPTVMMAAYNGGPANAIVRYVVSVNKRWARQ